MVMTMSYGVAAPAVQGAPVVVVPRGRAVATFTWADGVLAADIGQARQGALDLIANGRKNGDIKPESNVVTNPDGTFTLHLAKDVKVAFFTAKVTLDCNGTLAASTDATGKPNTVFSLSDGRVDSHGMANQKQITAVLMAWAQNWEKQAQLEPPSAPSPPLPTPPAPPLPSSARTRGGSSERGVAF